MRETRVVLCLTAGALVATLGWAADANAQACYAAPASLTPPAWIGPAADLHPRLEAGLTLVREVPLPGPANRFDYQSLDPVSGRLYIDHMDAGRTVVFDVSTDRVVAEIAGVPRATGVLAVPSHHQVYVSAAGAHEVAIIDDRTLTIVHRIGGLRFPDGIAYAPTADKVFVSDESGGTDAVIDATTGARRSTILLGGEAGNTHYDSVSHCVIAAVQTRNQLVAIDPFTETIVHRYDVPGSNLPHGFTIDAADRLAFISSEGNASLIVLDLRTMAPIQRLRVADDPDVLAWDASLRLLYVATESGVVSAFWLGASGLEPIGEIRAPHAHTVSVDPRTHRLYVPLENIGGRPVLRIYEPGRSRTGLSRAPLTR